MILSINPIASGKRDFVENGGAKSPEACQFNVEYSMTFCFLQINTLCMLQVYHPVLLPSGASLKA